MAVNHHPVVISISVDSNFYNAGTGWGDQGYTWIDYDLLPQVSFIYVYVINN
jgi:hypothetical protein